MIPHKSISLEEYGVDDNDRTQSHQRSSTSSPPAWRRIPWRLWIVVIIVSFLIGTQVGYNNFTVNNDNLFLSSTSIAIQPNTLPPSHEHTTGNSTATVTDQNNDNNEEVFKFQMFYDEDDILGPSQTKKRAIDYPFIPPVILDRCGLSRFSSNQSLALRPLQHSLAFIKPHKTGSSTIRSLLDRILYGRGAIKMIPKDHTYIGWHPSRNFPGEVVHMTRMLQSGRKYDAFNSHARLTNRTHLSKYLKQPIVVFTIFREPISRTTSAYNFFFSEAMGTSWKQFLQKFSPPEKDITQWTHAVAGNNMAYSLGWYHQPHIKLRKYLDHNDTAIQAFLRIMHKQLDLVMILERLPESLLLLREKVLPELDVTELVWMDYAGANVVNIPNKTRRAVKKKTDYPDTDTTEALKEMLYLDRAIYDHYVQRFDRQWKDAVAKNPLLEPMEEALRCTQNALFKSMEDPDIVSPLTKMFLTSNVGTWMKFFEYRQLKWLDSIKKHPKTTANKK